MSLTKYHSSLYNGSGKPTDGAALYFGWPWEAPGATAVKSCEKGVTEGLSE